MRNSLRGGWQICQTRSNDPVKKAIARNAVEFLRRFVLMEQKKFIPVAAVKYTFNSTKIIR